MYKVLIIDDEPWILEDIKELACWHRVGFEIVAEAGNGLEAEQIIKKLKPDMIVCDIRMPYMNGLELLKLVNLKYNEILTVFLSAYSDFNYAQQAIQLGAFDYILKPVEEEQLEKVLLRASLKLEEDKRINSRLAAFDSTELFYELMDSKVLNNKQKKCLIDYGFRLEDIVYCLVDIKFTDIDSYTISSTCEEFFSRNPGVKFLPVMAGNKKWIYLIYYHSMNRINGLDLYEALAKNDRCSKINVGISENFTSLGYLKEAYRQADLMVDSSFLSGRDGVYLYKREDQAMISAYFDEVRAAGNMAELVRIAGKMDEIVRKAEGNLESLSRISNEISVTVARITHSKADTELLTEKDIIDSYDDFGQFKECLKKNLENYTKDTQRVLSNSLMKEILKYIDENYDKKLMLNKVAKHFYINPNYLSQLFKQEMNTSFTIYLTELKINRAIRLLEETDMTLYEISEKVGYDDYFHFSKIFKKEKGVSPSAFRKKQKDL